MVYEIDETLQLAEKMQKEKPESKKVTQPVIDELNSLKKTLVITTGDNYVGSAENELREDILDLYSKVASRYDKPTQAEMENLAVLEKEMQEARDRMEKIRKKEIKKMEQYMEKNEMEKMALQSFDEFVKGS